MQTIQPRALRQATERVREICPSCDLASVAAIVFGAGADEDDAREVVRAGQELLAAGDADVGFFLVAWGAQKVATLRIACGDLGIDEALAHVEALTQGSADWQEAVAEYQRLADEILIDTLNEFREFDLVRLYSGRREDYAKRWAAGMAEMARRHPARAGNSRSLALAS